jgi:hypothetical protein
MTGTSTLRERPAVPDFFSLVYADMAWLDAEFDAIMKANGLTGSVRGSGGVASGPSEQRRSQHPARRTKPRAGRAHRTGDRRQRSPPSAGRLQAASVQVDGGSQGRKEARWRRSCLHRKGTTSAHRLLVP